MTQLAMIVDLNRCVGCHTCAVACRAAWQVPVAYQRSWVKRLGPDQTPTGMAHTFYPGHCNHCTNPVCVPVCPVPPEPMEFHDQNGLQSISLNVSATYKNPINGTVQINRDRCIGCGACVSACPYGARFLNEELKPAKADKCSFCVEYQKDGRSPACVDQCPTGARIFGDLADSSSEVAKYVAKGAVRLESQSVSIGSNVYYAGRQEDIFLLLATSRPTVMPVVPPRRVILSSLARPIVAALRKQSRTT